MINTRKITNLIIDKSEFLEDELNENLNLLEEEDFEERYMVNVDDKEIKSLNSLIEYYDNLNSNVDKINFYKFALYIMKDEELTNNFLQELKNISLLKRTGLLKYAHEQENYSKQIISNFLLKLDKVKEDKKDNIIQNEIENVDNKLNLIKKYKSFFAPIGIVKEIEDANQYYKYIKTLNLEDEEALSAILMALKFNCYLHEEKLDMYELDFQKNTDLIKKVYLVSNLDKIKKNATKKNITKILSKNKKRERKNKEKNDKLNENIEEDYKYLLLEQASKVVRENKDKDPYDLFVEYYDVLLGNKKDNVCDKKILKKAMNYLKSHEKLIVNLNEITKTDLNETINVYKNKEKLREEVYNTTEDIERLLAYEIKEIINNKEENTNSVNLIDKLRPVVNYIDKIKDKKNKKK